MTAMAKKDAVVTIDSLDSQTASVTEKGIPLSGSKRPPLGYRRTTDGFGHELEKDHLGPVQTFLSKLMENEIGRYLLYIIPVAALLAIPVALFSTIFIHVTLDGHTPVAGMFVWIELCWVWLWVSKILATIIPVLYQSICGFLTTGLRKYTLVLRAIKTPLSIFLWSVLCMASYSEVYAFNRAYHDQHRGQMQWLSVFHRVLKVSVGMAAIWLAEKILVELVSVAYYSRQYHDDIKALKKTSRAIDLLYDASRRIFPDHHPFVVEEDYDIHDADNLRTVLRKRAADEKTLRMMSDLRLNVEKVTSAFGQVARDITGQEVMKPTSTHAIVEQALDRRAGAEALARRIFKSLCPAGSEVITAQDICRELGAGKEREAQWVFAQLDRDQNGDVSRDEMLFLVTNTSQKRKNMWKSACDVKDAIKILDRVLSFIVFLIVCVFYTAVFSTFLQKNGFAVFTAVSGSAFALSTTIGEFNSCCILIFIKHPYDIGDRVSILGSEYEVLKISLLYTVFKRVDTDAYVTIENKTVSTQWIDNLSRSPAMKERLTFSVSAATTFDDIELLRQELETFVRDPENRRHFQSDVDIQLLSVGDLKQLDLRVEILHKSNWSNEKLRAERRSRFMCALLSVMRKVPIDGPAGSAPAAGSINNPNYSVAITDDEAKASRARFDNDKSSQKLASQQTHPGGASTGLEILKSLTLRRSSAAVPDGESARPSMAGPNPFAESIQRGSIDIRPTNYPARPEMTAYRQVTEH